MTERAGQALDVVLKPSAELSTAALERLFAASWPEGSAPRFDLERSLCWVSAHVGERLVGFVNVIGDGGVHAVLLDTSVLPELRRRGIGRALVGCAAEEARALGAEWLHVDYVPSHAEFYRRCGFRPTPAGLMYLLAGPEGEIASAPGAVSVRKYSPADAATCRELMQGLGDWFGEPAREAYAADLARLPTWVARLEGEPGLAGFVSLTCPAARALEVHVLAVARPLHGRGVGRALMAMVERFAAARGARFLQAKTLGPSHPDPAFAGSRAFWQRLGFEPLFESDRLWGEGNPALVLVKAIG